MTSKYLPIPSKPLDVIPNLDPFIGTTKEEEIHPFEFPIEFEENILFNDENTLNCAIQQGSLASLTPNHHLLYPSHDLSVQESLKSISSTTIDLDPPYDPTYLFDHSNQGYNPNLMVNVKMEGESLVEWIPILMEDEDENPFIEVHR